MDLDKLPENDFHLEAGGYPVQQAGEQSLRASRSFKVESRVTSLQITQEYPAAALQSQKVANKALLGQQTEAIRHSVVPPASLKNRLTKCSSDDFVKLFGSADFFIRWVNAQAAIVAEEVQQTRKLKKHQAIWQAAHAAFQSELDRINAQKQDALKSNLTLD